MHDGKQINYWEYVPVVGRADCLEAADNRTQQVSNLSARGPTFEELT